MKDFKDYKTIDDFKKDALKHLGIDGHKNADKAFDIAWDLGHSCGYADVYDYLSDLADLLK